MGDDDGTQQVAVLYHGSLLHLFLKLFELVFQLCGLHVLAVRKDNDFLAATGNVYTSAFIETCQIAGVEKAFGIDDGGGLLRTVVIALHQIGTFGTKLTVYQFHLHGRKGHPGTPGDNISRTGKGYHRCRFCHAVAFKHFEAQGPQSAAHLYIEGGTATDTELKVSAKLFMHRLKDGARQGEAVRLFAQGEEGTCQHMGVNLALDAVVEGLPQTGHTHHDADLGTTEGGHDVGSRH